MNEPTSDAEREGEERSSALRPGMRDSWADGAEPRATPHPVTGRRLGGSGEEEAPRMARLWHDRRPQRGLVSLTAAAGALLAVLIGAIFTAFIWSGNNVRETGLAERQSHAALSQSRLVDSLVLDIETGQRGFIITRDPHFLEPWKAAQARFPGQAAKLVRLSESPAERNLAVQISRAGRSFIDTYSTPLVDEARHGNPQSSSLTATVMGQKKVDALRHMFDRYTATEQSDVAAREAAADASARRATAVASAGFGASVLLIGTYSAYVIRVIVWPVRTAAAVATQLAVGDLRARMPMTGRREIEQLETAFNTMAESLASSLAQARRAHGRLKLLYDSSVAVGTTLDVTRTARELVDVAIPRFADFATVDLAMSALRGDEPTVTGDTSMQRVAVGGIRHDSPLEPEGTVMACHRPPTEGSPSAPQPLLVRDLSTCSAWRGDSPQQAERLLAYGMTSLITIPLTTQHILLGTVTFWRSRSAPFERQDLIDAEGLAVKAAVAVDNARRYTHERDSALTLQHALLPQRPAEQPAVDVAYRYLPADTRAGVGGDWFDVIPLSGVRVALVVGDIVGHGIHASAAMGRLRTAVRTLADVDLPPDELLTHLDDLVLHLEDAPANGERGATCIYAVYDPVSRHCTLASAGHPLPFVIAPDGTVQEIAGEIGPPVGVGGLPFENIELDLAEGSTLALYSDGLVHSWERDFGEGLAMLRSALASSPGSLEAACSTILDTLLPGPPQDDVVLLLARTCVLTSDRVVTWDIPADPEEVSRARALAVEQLEAWRLDELSFVTELVVSELVTNAIRYGAPPIQLRLIRDTALICEVSDSSNTAPHLRRARTFDEGGRGLLLVAQLTQRWGTRHAKSGKTIWCEQSLAAPDHAPRTSEEPDGGTPSPRA
ncbi:SpoIIE family protein phosphatase [Streptomyces sp. NPDC057062]|uniref:SpoIIE family protein phosphatase n=1 Tax=Streptomyces sp. NPDC057062 TaxID=3346011 RepID=UPI0036372262